MTDQPSSKAFTDNTPVNTNGRHDGWTAQRQRIFLENLASTGVVRDAARAAGMSAQSAYVFRVKPEAAAFARGWNHALRLASALLVSIAFDRAINGVVETTMKDGEIVSEKRRYSDRLLMFLISHNDALRYGKLAGIQNSAFDPVVSSAKRLEEIVGELTPEIDPQDMQALAQDADCYGDEHLAAPEVTTNLCENALLVSA